VRVVLSSQVFFVSFLQKSSAVVVPVNKSKNNMPVDHVSMLSPGRKP